MATSGASEGGFSGRAGFVLRFEMTRISVVNSTTNRFHAELRAINRSGYVSYDLTARPFSVGGSAQGSGSWVPDFRGTSDILIWAADFNLGTNSEGNSSVNWSASAGPAGIFGSASTSGSFAVNRIPQVPDKMGTPSLKSSTDSSITWNTPGAPSDNGGSSITTYQWQKALNTAYTSGESNGTFSAGAAVTNNGLEPNTTYYFRVRAKNGVGWGDWSNNASGKTKVGVPSAPRSVVVADVQPAAVQVDWVTPADLNGGAITGYVVQVATNSSMSSPTEYSFSGTATDYTVQGLLPSTQYWFRVIALNSAGRSPASPTVTATTVSGAYVSNGSAWKGAGVFVSDGTAWAPATIAVDRDGAWVDAV